MFINNMKVTNFGYIKNIDLVFEADKINIIQGPNASGKTTILALIYSMFQTKEVLKYNSNQKEIATIDISFNSKGINHKILKHYQEGCPKIVVNSLDEMKSLITVNFDKIFLFYGEFLRDTYWLSDTKIKAACELLDRLNIEKDPIFDDYLDNNKKYRFASHGKQMLLSIISLLATIPNESVFLCDDPFASLDIETADKLYDVMERIKDVQFILTSNSMLQINRTFHKINLSVERGYEQNVSLSFDYERLFFKDIKKRLSKFDSIIEPEENKKPIIKYRMNEDVSEEENRNVEFKEIKGINPCESIVSTAEIYIVAFLNSWVTGLGVIKWGISYKGKVKGVKLAKEDRDNIRKKFSERISQIEPYLSQDLVHISFQEIIDDNDEIIPEVYIVEIIIDAIQKIDLFATSKGEVYIKTESGKAKLNPYGVQQELKRRYRITSN